MNEIKRFNDRMQYLIAIRHAARARINARAAQAIYKAALKNMLTTKYTVVYAKYKLIGGGEYV